MAVDTKSMQMIAHANSDVMRQRVTSILVAESVAGMAVAPAVDPFAQVVEHRWVWASKWQNMIEVDDNHIVVAVRDMWPLPEVPAA